MDMASKLFTFTFTSQAYVNRCREKVALQDRPPHAESFDHSPVNALHVLY